MMIPEFAQLGDAQLRDVDESCHFFYPVGHRVKREQKEIGKERVMKEKSKGLKESKKAPQLSLKEKRKLKKEKKNR